MGFPVAGVGKLHIIAGSIIYPYLCLVPQKINSNVIDSKRNCISLTWRVQLLFTLQRRVAVLLRTTEFISKTFLLALEHFWLKVIPNLIKIHFLIPR
jgi:hypothetical protein